jgi:hypothetical protein
MSARQTLLLLTVLSFELAARMQVATAQTSGAVFRLRDPGDLAAIELVDASPRVTRPTRRPVSDMMVLIDGPPGALAVANGARPERGRTLFRVRLVLVAGGRLMSGAVASCTPWDRDRAVCAMPCDGGDFLLRRSPAGAGEGLDLVIGTPAEDGGEWGAGGLEYGVGGSSGLALGDCSWEGGGGPRLTPIAGRNLVELPLIGD